MKNLNNAVVKTIVTYVLYVVAVASVALIVSGLCESTTVTVNWVRLLIGGAVLYAVNFTCDLVFPKNKK